MTVSLCVIAYNEEEFLENLLDDMLSQTYSHEMTEIVLVDGMSEDNTKMLMLSFKESHQSEYMGIKVLDNPKRIQAAGWNIAIKNAIGDVIIRIDAHAHIPKEFTEKNMKLQKSGEYITGGVRVCITEKATAWANTLLEVENSLFGSGIAESRHSNEKKYVKTMFHAAYRRNVFDKAGLFNEHLLRTEDNELHYRIRKCGYRLCFDSDIVSCQYARNSLKKMIKQKYGNGYWIGLTLGICPGCISIYHLVPFMFVLGIYLTSLLICFGIWQLALLMWISYAFFSLISMFIVIKKRKGNKWIWCMPILFLILHISYGVGTLIGLVEMPFMRKKLIRG